MIDMILKSTLFCSVLLLVGCHNSTNVDNDEEDVYIETRAKEWSIRPVASIVESDIKTTASRFGQIANDAKNKNLKQMKPYGRRYIDIVFAENNDTTYTYQSMFHQTTLEGTQDRWYLDVVVAPADSDKNISLSLRGVYVLSKDDSTAKYKEFLSRSNPILSNIYLKDIDNGVCIKVKDGSRLLSYRFGMQGDTRHRFEFVLDGNMSQDCNTTITQPKLYKVQPSQKISTPQEYRWDRPPEPEFYR
jgi:hypothetical protein